MKTITLSTGATHRLSNEDAALVIDSLVGSGRAGRVVTVEISDTPRLLNTDFVVTIEDAADASTGDATDA